MRTRSSGLVSAVLGGVLSLFAIPSFGDEARWNPTETALSSISIGGSVDTSIGWALSGNADSTSLRAEWAQPESGAEWITQLPSGDERKSAEILRRYELQWAGVHSLQAMFLGERPTVIEESSLIRERLAAALGQLTSNTDSGIIEIEVDREHLREAALVDRLPLRSHEALDSPSSVPEPNAWVLVILGAASLTLLRWKCRLR